MTRRRTRGRSGRQRSRLTPWWLIAVVACGLVSYVVVKRSDEISELRFAGSGIAFRGSATTKTLPAEEQQARARDVVEHIEAQVREAPPAAEPSAVDLTGNWTTSDGVVTWAVSLENGLFVFREQNAAAPGVVSAAGYGSFDGQTWSLQFQTIFGAAGTASLRLLDEGVLEGEASVAGARFSLSLHR
jgi:hypothetical protein